MELVAVVAFVNLDFVGLRNCDLGYVHFDHQVPCDVVFLLR